MSSSYQHIVIFMVYVHERMLDAQRSLSYVSTGYKNYLLPDTRIGFLTEFFVTTSIAVGGLN